jgi:His-Xaa-Ser repeat protein HxsA
MRTIRTSITLLLSSLQLAGGKAAAIPIESDGTAIEPGGEAPVSLRPLNNSSDNLFAGHRSHSSHRSHQSHRSSSGGGYSVPRYQPPATQRLIPAPSLPKTESQPTDPGRAAPVEPLPWLTPEKNLTNAEKLTLQIMRVQIALTTLGLYSGPVDGVLGAGTMESIKRFQVVKGLKTNGLMTTETLNALGVPAVQ